MTSFTIFGNGNMGQAIGSILGNNGNDVVHVAHDQSGTTQVSGDVVVLAVPFQAVEGIVAQYADQFVGKVVVDVTNPLNFDTFDALVVPVGSSSAAELQAALPDSSVLKAFNTNFAATLASKKIGDLSATVLIAGNDPAAKKTLADAVTAGGLIAIDAGPLSRAHELEALGFLQLTLAASEKIGWDAGFAVVR